MYGSGILKQKKCSHSHAGDIASYSPQLLIRPLVQIQINYFQFTMQQHSDTEATTFKYSKFTMQVWPEMLNSLWNVVGLGYLISLGFFEKPDQQLQ